MVARRSPKPQAGVRLPTRLPRGLAQSGSALALGARGRRFESCIPDQYVSVAEWLRNGLQIRVERLYRFKSCRSLQKRLTTIL